MMDKKNGDWQKKSTFMNFLKVWDERMYFLVIEEKKTFSDSHVFH